MNIVLIKRDSDEWNYMWDKVAQHPLNEGVDEPIVALNEGESWQYMGTIQKDDKFIHEFRHRNHPKTNLTQKIVFVSENNIPDNQIEITKVI